MWNGQFCGAFHGMVDVGVDCWWMAWRIILLFINRNGEKLPLSQRIWCFWRAEISAACMHPYLWVKPNVCIRLVHHLKLPKQIVFWQTTLEDRLKNIYLLNLGIELWYTWVSFFGLTCLYNGPCCLLARPATAGFILQGLHTSWPTFNSPEIKRPMQMRLGDSRRGLWRLWDGGVSIGI